MIIIHPGQSIWDLGSHEMQVVAASMHTIQGYTEGTLFFSLTRAKACPRRVLTQSMS